MILGDSTSGAQWGASILDCCLAVLCKTLKDKGVMVQGLTVRSDPWRRTRPLHFFPGVQRSAGVPGVQ